MGFVTHRPDSEILDQGHVTHHSLQFVYLSPYIKFYFFCHQLIDCSCGAYFFFPIFHADISCKHNRLNHGRGKLGTCAVFFARKGYCFLCVHLRLLNLWQEIRNNKHSFTIMWFVHHSHSMWYQILISVRVTFWNPPLFCSDLSLLPIMDIVLTGCNYDNSSF